MNCRTGTTHFSLVHWIGMLLTMNRHAPHWAWYCTSYKKTRAHRHIRTLVFRIYVWILLDPYLLRKIITIPVIDRLSRWPDPIFIIAILSTTIAKTLFLTECYKSWDIELPIYRYMQRPQVLPWILSVSFVILSQFFYLPRF